MPISEDAFSPPYERLENQPALCTTIPKRLTSSAFGIDIVSVVTAIESGGDDQGASEGEQVPANGDG